MFKSKSLHFMAKATVTLVVLWLVLRGVKLEYWRPMLQRQNGFWLAAVIGITLFLNLMAVLRWHMLLATISPDRKAGIGFLDAGKIFYMGSFFNICMPGLIGGDVIRAWLIKSERIPLTRAVHSVIIDRLIGLLGLSVLIALVLLPLGRMAGFNALPLLLAMLAGGAIGLCLLFQTGRIPERWRHRPPLSWLLYLAENLRRLFQRPLPSLLLLLFAFTGHVLYCLCVYALAQSLNIGINAWQCIVLIQPIPLLMALPVSVGGWGLREAGIVTMLALAGVPKEAALMVSIQLGLIAIAVNLPGGILWLAHKSHARQH